MYSRRASNYVLMLNYVLVDMYLVGIMMNLRWNLTLRFWDRGLLYAALTGTPYPSTSVRALAD